jgi:hypothetical protein
MDVLSSAIGTLGGRCVLRSRPEFPCWHPGWETFYTRPPPPGAAVFNFFIPGTRSITMGVITAGRRHSRAKGLAHDFSHPSDAYAFRCGQSRPGWCGLRELCTHRTGSAKRSSKPCKKADTFWGGGTRVRRATCLTSRLRIPITDLQVQTGSWALTIFPPWQPEAGDSSSRGRQEVGENNAVGLQTLLNAVGKYELC